MTWFTCFASSPIHWMRSALPPYCDRRSWRSPMRLCCGYGCWEETSAVRCGASRPKPPPILAKTMPDWRARREYVSFDRLLLEAMDECGYRPENGSRGAANIDKFLAQARAARANMTLDQFVGE